MRHNAQKQRAWLSIGLAASVLTAIAGGASAGGALAETRDPPRLLMDEPVSTSTTLEEKQAMDLARGLSAAFRRAARTIEPSVVHITAVRNVRRNMMVRRGGGLGSGVVATEDGFILTNSHVVEDATALRVRLSDGREYAAELVGRDATTDLAVLRIEASGLTPARFTDSDRVEVGDWVLAAGSPFGFDQSVTAGIVSAKGRRGLARNDTDRFEDFIQTDAAVNPGNSGGPLVDLEGRVVGINTAIFSRSGGSIGIGFAIPANMARAVFEDLADDGRIQRAWLGVSMRDLTPEGVSTYGVADTGGVYVDRVVEQSPAFEAEIQPGDVIVRVDGRPVRDSQRLRALIALSRPGATFDLEVVRDGRRFTTEALLTDQASGLANSLADLGGASSRELGLVVIQATASTLRRVGQPTWLEGVVVADVLAGSAAEDAGLQVGDVIVSLNGTPTPISTAFDEAVMSMDVSDGVEVELFRRGRSGRGVIRP